MILLGQGGPHIVEEASSPAKGTFFVDDSLSCVVEGGRLSELRQMRKMLRDHHVEIWDREWDGTLTSNGGNKWYRGVEWAWTYMVVEDGGTLLGQC